MFWRTLGRAQSLPPVSAGREAENTIRALRPRSNESDDHGVPHFSDAKMLASQSTRFVPDYDDEEIEQNKAFALATQYYCQIPKTEAACRIVGKEHDLMKLQLQLEGSSKLYKQVYAHATQNPAGFEQWLRTDYIPDLSDEDILEILQDLGAYGTRKGMAQ